ncbi:hypothetical protein C5U62_31665 [Pseudomonas protegens]|uniref:Uncharacterized protein n=1 Tax=Pseudomonas protegens TaxID=380021 RepID=A0A2T6GBJ5_9PSED|nr:hypothetical protein [Pseudomonas protegens]PUA41523.1 hypothetical protein C5U62_31665 [Pseudomonas protegens]
MTAPPAKPFTPTDADLRALDDLPAAEWFSGMFAPTARGAWRCERLERAGLLESRVVQLPTPPGSVHVFTSTEYRRLPAAPTN